MICQYTDLHLLLHKAISSKTFMEQDWTTVVFKKRGPTQEQKEAQKRASQSQPGYISNLADATEHTTAKMFEKAYIDQVIAKRAEKKWTQKQLATAINVEANRIQRFEQGKEVYDHNLKSKLNRALDIHSCNHQATK